MKKTTDEQKVIFNWIQQGSGNGIIKAVAGAGKTTTLITGLQYMEGKVFFGAFNRSVADDIKLKLTKIKTQANTTVNTLHAEGLRRTKAAYPNALLDKDKYQKLIDELIVNGHTLFQEFHTGKLKNYRYLMVKAVSLARQWLLYPDSPYASWIALFDHFGLTAQIERELDREAILECSRILLDFGIKNIGRSFDFEDVIYSSNHDEKIRALPYKFNWVIVDEAQDTNDSRRAFLKTLLHEDGRFIAVGDPYQAIYGFSGANHDSMELIRQEFNCKTEMTLSTTFRCPKKIVEQVQYIVPHIRAHEGNAEGEIVQLHGSRMKDFLTEYQFPADSAILCRNTKHLIDAYLHLLKRGLPCHIEGSEICKDYLLVLRKYRHNDLKDFRKALYPVLEDLKKTVPDKDQQELYYRKIECLETLIEVSNNFSTYQELYSFFEKAFKDTKEDESIGSIVLSTVHKAKGREWDTVFLLGRKELMPSKYAKQPWELVQEQNLVYVAMTRAKNTLVEISIL